MPHFAFDPYARVNVTYGCDITEIPTETPFNWEEKAMIRKWHNFRIATSSSASITITEPEGVYWESKQVLQYLVIDHYVAYSQLVISRGYTCLQSGRINKAIASKTLRQRKTDELTKSTRQQRSTLQRIGSEPIEPIEPIEPNEPSEPTEEHNPRVHIGDAFDEGEENHFLADRLGGYISDFVNEQLCQVEAHILCCINGGLARRVREPTANKLGSAFYVFAARMRSIQTFIEKARKKPDWNKKVERLRDPVFRQYLNEAKRRWLRAKTLSELHHFYANYPLPMA
jgi:hypothetical protein